MVVFRVQGTLLCVSFFGARKMREEEIREVPPKRDGRRLESGAPPMRGARGQREKVTRV